MQTIEELADLLYSILSSPNKINESNITNIILNNNSERRIAIANIYKYKYNPDGIKSDFKKRLSGNYKDVVCHLFSPPEEYDCYQLREALKGFDTDDECIYEIITGRTQYLLNEIRIKYQEMNNRTLENEIKKCFPDEIGRNLILLMNTPRNENDEPDHEECKRRSEILIQVDKEDKWVTDEKIFTNIFLKASPEEIVLTARYYLQKTGNNLLNVVEKRMNGKNRVFMVELLLNVINPAEGFADKLNHAIKGLGTNTNLLERVLITRNECDMNDIRKIYLRKFNAELESDIEDDTSGEYQVLLLGLARK